MKLHVIVVSYERQIPLRGLIDSFLLQSNPNWQMSIIHDGPPSSEYVDFLKNTYGLNRKGQFNDKRISFCYSATRHHTKENPSWGHVNRNVMLKRIIGDPLDYVLITNDDNYYVPFFVDEFLKYAHPTIGMVYCDTVLSTHGAGAYNILKSELRECAIDMGSFIVRLDIAQTNGFNHVNHSADGKYCVECKTRCKQQGLKTIYIPKPLFIHN